MKGNGPVFDLLGTGLTTGSDVGLVFTDEVVGGLAGDTATQAGVFVDTAGDRIKCLPVVGEFAGPVFNFGGRLVKLAGGDQK